MCTFLVKIYKPILGDIMSSIISQIALYVIVLIMADFGLLWRLNVRMELSKKTSLIIIIITIGVISNII
jgi:hypothetical protein